MVQNITKAFSEAENIRKDFITPENIASIEKAANIIIDAFTNKRKIIICGNGGSCCDANHFAEEFTGRFRKDRKPLPVISLSDSAHITCVGNDYGFNHIFSRGVAAYGESGDILIGVSTSGNSQNVLNAVQIANDMGLTTIGLLGKDGGKVRKNCNHTIIVRGDSTDRIQEVHITILHIIIEMVERSLFPENY